MKDLEMSLQLAQRQSQRIMGNEAEVRSGEIPDWDGAVAVDLRHDVCDARVSPSVVNPFLQLLGNNLG